MLYGQIKIKEAQQQYTTPEEGSWGRAGKHSLVVGGGGALLGGGLGALAGLVRGDMEAVKDVGLSGAALGGVAGAGIGAWNGSQKESPGDYLTRLSLDPAKHQEAIDMVAQHMYKLKNPKADMSKTNLNHPHFNYVKPIFDEVIKYRK
jgi:hypothetical protein